MLDLLDEADPEAIAAWAAALDRPPVLITREREPTVLCQAVVQVGDEPLARRVLDGHYRTGEGATWEELFELGPDEYLIRATLRLDGSRLTIETNSEERMDRVLGVLKTDIPEMKVLSDERTPLDLAKAGRSCPPGPGSPPPDGTTTDGRETSDAVATGGQETTGASASRQQEVPLPLEVRRQLQQRFEARWCEEQVPALGGITPREAAADPSRRETLERLLAEMERANLASARGGRNYASGALARNARPAVEAALSSGAQFWRPVLAPVSSGPNRYGYLRSFSEPMLGQLRSRRLREAPSITYGPSCRQDAGN